MHPYINALGRDIPVFGLMALAGIGAALGIVALLCPRKGVNRSDATLTALMAVACAMAGAWLIGPIIKLPDVLIHWERYSSMPLGSFLAWFAGGIVYYGGFIGGAAGALIFCRAFKMPFLPMADIYAVALPAGHALGRVGCFFGGCCFGVEVPATHPLAVTYPPRHDGLDAVAAPAGVPLLPVPLIEAAGNLIISAAVLCFLYLTRRSAVPGRALALYGLLYSAQRFTIEFFRGDALRGVYGGVSTSQYISVALFALSAALMLWTFRKKKPPLCPAPCP
ncbi:MAG: prolipoprotein diacylglyceryl transferase [Oscillospiraceae bacterium]|jgi:phosphatidylglycerol:prolipoprotein diacylglycerol transferase|nr:prolipoprotein diacylglyceryl transferase [Oscillospiraceae bacterium]